MGPGVAVAEVRHAVRACLADLKAGDLVLVACSGGADSLALAAAAAFVAPRLGLRAGGVTVDHGLQPGSAERAGETTALLSALSLDPVKGLSVTVAPSAAGPEAAARQARYGALDLAAREHGAEAVLLGHTLDDQAETVLLGLARGSGGRSLAGMPARRGAYRRPLLAVRRATTAAACAELGLEPWQDPHNRDFRFARARVRHQALPALEAALGPGVAEALARTAGQLRADADCLDDLAFAESGRLRGSGSDPPGLDVGWLRALPAAIRARVLRDAAVMAGCPGGALGAGHVAGIDALVTGWHGQRGVDLPGGVQARRRDGKVWFTAVLVKEGGDPLDERDMGAQLKQVLITADQLQARIGELAAQIDADYSGRDLLLIGVLKGAVMVMADLARAMHLPVQMDWMAISSYGSGTKSSGVVRILKDLDTDITGRHVLIVEDIVDSGLTLSWLAGNLRSRSPASLAVCAMLRKPGSAQMHVDVAYTGFDIGDEFVVGYGLDYAQRYRNLPFIGTLAPAVYEGG
jgi:hypoxanthine phosphoribosyltransferase